MSFKQTAYLLAWTCEISLMFCVHRTNVKSVKPLKMCGVLCRLDFFIFFETRQILLVFSKSFE